MWLLHEQHYYTTVQLCLKKKISVQWKKGEKVFVKNRKNRECNIVSYMIQHSGDVVNKLRFFY